VALGELLLRRAILRGRALQYRARCRGGGETREGRTLNARRRARAASVMARARRAVSRALGERHRARAMESRSGPRVGPARSERARDTRGIERREAQAEDVVRQFVSTEKNAHQGAVETRSRGRARGGRERRRERAGAGRTVVSPS